MSAGGLALAQPGAARAGSPYISFEAGGFFGRDNDVDEPVSYSSSQTPATPAGPATPGSMEFDDVFSLDYAKPGFEAGIIGGYDFGWFRLELELSHKRAGLGNIRADDTTDNFLTSVNAELNRPSAAPDPGAPGLQPLTIEDFELDGKMRATSAMLNALLDLKVTDRMSVYGGGGTGASQVKSLGAKDSAHSWQYIIGTRYKVGPKVEFGLKYRYFNSGIVKLHSERISYNGNPDRLSIDGTFIDQTTELLSQPQIEGKFRERSILASLFYNF